MRSSLLVLLLVQSCTSSALQSQCWPHHFSLPSWEARDKAEQRQEEEEQAGPHPATELARLSLSFLPPVKDDQMSVHLQPAQTFLLTRSGWLATSYIVRKYNIDLDLFSFQFQVDTRPNKENKSLKELLLYNNITSLYMNIYYVWKPSL